MIKSQLHISSPVATFFCCCTNSALNDTRRKEKEPEGVLMRRAWQSGRMWLWFLCSCLVTNSKQSSDICRSRCINCILPWLSSSCASSSSKHNEIMEALTCCSSCEVKPSRAGWGSPPWLPQKKDSAGLWMYSQNSKSSVRLSSRKKIKSLWGCVCHLSSRDHSLSGCSIQITHKHSWQSRLLTASLIILILSLSFSLPLGQITVARKKRHRGRGHMRRGSRDGVWEAVGGWLPPKERHSSIVRQLQMRLSVQGEGRAGCYATPLTTCWDFWDTQ